jgi:hypothetical protein
MRYRVRVAFWINVEAENKEKAKDFAEWAAYARLGIKPDSIEIRRKDGKNSHGKND